MIKQLLGALFVLAIYAAVLGLCGCAPVSAHAATGLGMVSDSGRAQRFTFQRKYTMGDKDVYLAAMEMGKKVSTTMTQTQLVTKVYDDGTADISITTSDMKMSIDGKDTPIPAGVLDTMTVHYDKYGGPTDMKLGGGSASAMPFSFSDMSFARTGISLGQTIPYETAVKNDVQSKGTVTFAEVVDGAAKLHILCDSIRAGKADGHIDAFMFMDMSSGKLSKAELTITLTGGDASHLTMTRQAS